MFPTRLRAADLVVKIHDDQLRDKVDDEVWIDLVGRNDWVAISHNAGIRYTSRERDQVMFAGIRLLIVKGAAPASVLADNFVRTLPSILRPLRRNPDPLIAKVLRHPHDASKPGRVEPWLQFKDWKLRQK